MRKSFIIFIIIFASTAFWGGEIKAQTSVARLLARADSAQLVYDFQLASNLLQRASDMDSTVQTKSFDAILAAQNGLNMMGFCSQPVVVAKQCVPLKDFFLFYPLQKKSWRKEPNQLDSLGGDNLSRGMYIPDEAKEIYYSAKDSEGIKNIYTTKLVDSLWTAPRLLNEHMTSSSNEIYPMISPDGKSLYFSSKGLYGMGGYDLYVSNWNEETKDWDVPENLGFPYSSPYDDFLFTNTEDGKYSIFASNRDCSKDSVCLYVLEYEVMPVRKAVTDIKELRELASLTPEHDQSKFNNDAAVHGDNPHSEDTQRYMDKMMEVRGVRDSISRFDKHLSSLRARYSSANESEKNELTAEITKMELQLPSLNDSLATAIKALQAIEMDFLSKGVIIDTEKLQAQADKEVVGADKGFAFSKNSFGPDIHLDMMKPKVDFDYSFKVLPEGQFAQDNNLPEGLVYQIQIFTQQSKATVNDLKGLSPVFEKAWSSQKYTYSVGLFRNYKDVLSKLNTVKKKGFRDAIIVAWLNGDSIGISKARALESEIVTSYFVVVYPVNGQSINESTVNIFKSHGDKDIVKGMDGGAVVFKAGPFEDEQEANDIVDAIKATGEVNVSLETTSITPNS